MAANIRHSKASYSATACCHLLQVPDMLPGRQPSGNHNQASAAAAAALPTTGDSKDDEDSVPLVSSKLAARLAVDKCTPMTHRHSISSDDTHDRGICGAGIVYLEHASHAMCQSSTIHLPNIPSHSYMVVKNLIRSGDSQHNTEPSSHSIHWFVCVLQSFRMVG